MDLVDGSQSFLLLSDTFPGLWAAELSEALRTQMRSIPVCQGCLAI